MSGIQELREKRTAAAERMNALVKFDAVGEPVSEWNADIAKQFAEAKTEHDGLLADIASYEAALNALPRPGGGSPSIGRGVQTANGDTALRAYLNSIKEDNPQPYTPDDRQIELIQTFQAAGKPAGKGVIVDMMGVNDTIRNFQRSSGFRNDWIKGTAAEGGDLQIDMLASEVIISMYATNAFLQAADVQTVDFLNTVPYPNVAVGDGQVVAEAASLGDTTPATAQIDLAFSRVAPDGYLPISYQLAYSTPYNLGGVVGRWAGEEIGVRAEAEFTNGTGNIKAYSTGLGAAFTETGATGEATALKYGTITNGMHVIKDRYSRRPGAGWMGSNKTLGQLGNVRADAVSAGDAAGAPILIPSTVDPFSVSIKGKPYYVNDAMPDQAANAYPLAYGDWSSYKILVFRGMNVQRFENELVLARAARIAFVADAWYAGALVDRRSIARIRNSAS